MRITFFILVFFLQFFKTGMSQDIIITQKGDTLNCKITEIDHSYIHFTFKFENEIRNTLLPVGEVKFYKKDFFAKSEVPIDKIKNITGSHQKVRIGGYGGWSYMTGKISDKIPSEFHPYIQELKSGYHFGGDVNYFSSENIGFGIKYAVFRTRNQLDKIYTVDTITGKIRTGIMKDDITHRYFGPTVCTRISSSSKKTNYISNFSLGYLSFKNNATIIDNFTLSGNTLGLFLDLGVDIAVEENLFLGLFFSYTMGTLNQISYDDGKQSKIIKLDKDNLEGLSRIDLSVALRWSK